MIILKILNVLLEDRIGGPQIRVLSVAKELRKYGVETIVACPTGVGDFSTRARNEQFKVVKIPFGNPKYFNSISSTITNIKWFFILPISIYMFVKIIKKENIDIVHVNGLLNFQAAFAALLTRKKIVWHLISSLYPKFLIIVLVPIVAMMADQIIFVAEKLGEYYLRKKIKSPSKNISIIYEGIDINKFDLIDDDMEKLRKDYDINISDIVIGCIGNVNPFKGYEYFIESAAFIKKRFDNTKFIVVGDIPKEQRLYYQKLQTLMYKLEVDKQIVFAGRKDNIPQILNLFDILVLSSIEEGTPLVILEAMAMKKPVCATDVGAIREQVSNGITGIIVPSRDPHKMAIAIIYLIDHPNERMIMGKRGREIVEKMFSINKCAEEHRKIYEDVYCVKV